MQLLSVPRDAPPPEEVAELATSVQLFRVQEDPPEESKSAAAPPPDVAKLLLNAQLLSKPS
jgi:hypothetical protein